MSKNDISKEQPESPEVKLAREAVEAFSKNIRTKLYPVDLPEGGKDVILEALSEMEWDGRGALAVSKLWDQINDAEVKKDGDRSFIFVTGTECHAINFVCSNRKGKGIEAARKHASIVTEIMKAMKLVEADKQQLDALSQKLAEAMQKDAAEEHGIDVEDIEKTKAEAQAEA